MKILHLATQDKGGGGYEAAYRLHSNMRAAGVDSVMVVQNKTSIDETVFRYPDCVTIPDRFRHLCTTIWKKILRRYYVPSNYFYVDSPGVVSACRIVECIPYMPDVIIAHWISDFITTDILSELSLVTGAPVLWYLMDMGPLTGGCHYSLRCTGFTRQCGDCPQLISGRSKRDLSFSQWRARQTAVQNMNITPVAGSSWLVDRVTESSIFYDKQAEKILLGMNTDVFCLTNQVDARRCLGLPPVRKIIFFGAMNVCEERKGIRYLIEALEILYGMLECNIALREDILVVIAGSVGKAIKFDIPFEHHYIGLLQGDKMLATGYQAADIFVNASVEDAGPMMINEALLCGTPVVSFDMGVAPDLVHTGRTGYRARLRDTADMAIGLFQLLCMDDESWCGLRTECRTVGEQFCHPDVQVRAFIELCTLRVSKAHVQSSRRTSYKSS